MRMILSKLIQQLYWHCTVVEAVIPVRKRMTIQEFVTVECLVRRSCSRRSLVAAWVEPYRLKAVISGVSYEEIRYCLACFCHQDASKRS
jgi:hypothetical protein